MMRASFQHPGSTTIFLFFIFQTCAIRAHQHNMHTYIEAPVSLSDTSNTISTGKRDRKRLFSARLYS